MIKNIVLDFGHGGIDDKGNYTTAPSKMAKLPDGRVAYEGVINRQIGGKLLKLLYKHIKVFKTYCTVEPNDSRDLSLGHRVRFTNKFNPKETIFISIHNNASRLGKARGFEIFTSRGETKSDILAECIADEVEKLYKELELDLRYNTTDGDKDKEADFMVLTKTKCPAVLIECLFFDNVDDFDLLTDEEFQEKLVFKIYSGILNYIYIGSKQP